ncbi:MAG: hypothetical protein QW156_03865 [Candidatus Aenigmatarchaeota archaeon]
MGLSEVKTLLGIESNNTTNDNRLNEYLNIATNIHSGYNNTSTHYSKCIDLYACLLYLTFTNSTNKDTLEFFSESYQLELNQLYGDTT